MAEEQEREAWWPEVQRRRAAHDNLRYLLALFDKTFFKRDRVCPTNGVGLAFIVSRRTRAASITTKRGLALLLPRAPFVGQRRLVAALVSA